MWEESINNLLYKEAYHLRTRIRISWQRQSYLHSWAWAHSSQSLSQCFSRWVSVAVPVCSLDLLHWNELQADFMYLGNAKLNRHYIFLLSLPNKDICYTCLKSIMHTYTVTFKIFSHLFCKQVHVCVLFRIMYPLASSYCTQFELLESIMNFKIRLTCNP